MGPSGPFFYGYSLASYDGIELSQRCPLGMFAYSRARAIAAEKAAEEAQPLPVDIVELPPVQPRKTRQKKAVEPALAPAVEPAPAPAPEPELAPSPVSTDAVPAADA